jgi:hypothetical protein
MAEYRLAEKGLPIWKEQLRSAINEAKENSKNILELREYLKENFNIDMKIQNKNVSYLHPEKQKYCRGDKLGYAYTKEGITSSFAKNKESAKEVQEVNQFSRSYHDKPSSFNNIISGIEKIAQKIARDIEKENIRAKKKNIHKTISKEKQKQKSMERER